MLSCCLRRVLSFFSTFPPSLHSKNSILEMEQELSRYRTHHTRFHFCRHNKAVSEPEPEPGPLQELTVPVRFTFPKRCCWRKSVPCFLMSSSITSPWPSLLHLPTLSSFTSSSPLQRQRALVLLRGSGPSSVNLSFCFSPPPRLLHLLWFSWSVRTERSLVDSGPPGLSSSSLLLVSPPGLSSAASALCEAVQR